MWSIRSTCKVNLWSLMLWTQSSLPVETKIQMEVFKENRSYLPTSNDCNFPLLVLSFLDLYWKWRARGHVGEHANLRHWALWWGQSNYRGKVNAEISSLVCLKCSVPKPYVYLWKNCLEDGKLFQSKFLVYSILPCSLLLWIKSVPPHQVYLWSSRFRSFTPRQSKSSMIGSFSK